VRHDSFIVASAFLPAGRQALPTEYIFYATNSPPINEGATFFLPLTIFLPPTSNPNPLTLRLGRILSLSFRLSQGVLNIFSLQGCLQTIGFFSSLHVLLHHFLEC
jgi:hypothetical protein